MKIQLKSLLDLLKHPSAIERPVGANNQSRAAVAFNAPTNRSPRRYDPS